MQLSSTIQKIEYDFVPVYMDSPDGSHQDTSLYTKILQYPQELHII